MNEIPMEPELVTEARLVEVLRELVTREPLFHRREHVSSRADFERETAEDFWETGASGRRYSREFVWANLKERYERSDVDDFDAEGWEARDFHLREVAAHQAADCVAGQHPEWVEGGLPPGHGGRLGGGSGDGCEVGEGEPAGHGASQRGRSGDPEVITTDGSRPGRVATPDPHHGAQAGAYRHVDGVAGVVVADVHVVAGDHQPPVTMLGLGVSEGEPDDGTPGWNDVEVDMAMHVPQQQLGVEILVAQLADPADAPLADSADHGVQLAPGRGEHVPHVVALGAPLDDAGPDELLQPLRQQ